LLKSFSAEIYDARPPAAETLSFPFMLNAITEIDLEGIVLPAREAASPSAATLFLLEEGK
jgi:hypothetical protein